MDFGAHLPLMDFGGNPYTLEHLAAYTDTAARLGFSALSVNDHMVFSVPWLDGPTALAAMIGHSGTMTLATTVSLPVIRGPVPLAKTLGRHRPAQPRAARRRRRSRARREQDFDVRRPRLRRAMGAVSTSRSAPFAPCGEPMRRAVRRPLLLHRRDQPRSAPDAPRRPTDLARELGLGCRACAAPPAWPTGGWRRPTTRRRRRSARHGTRLQGLLPTHGKDPESFPNALATMWFYITDSRAEADRVMQERLVPTIHRPEEILRERLPVGPAELFAEKLSAFARAGVQRVFVWPVADEAHQLELFWEEVRPAVTP